MMGDGEAMGFIAHALQQKQSVGVALQYHRIGLTRQEHALFRALDLGAARRCLNPHLGQAHRLNAVDADFGHGRQSHRQLSLAAIDDDQFR